MNSQNERPDGMTHAALALRCAGLEAELQGMREKAAALDADLDEIDRAANRYHVRSGMPRQVNILNALKCLHLNYRKFRRQWETADRYWQAQADQAQRHLCKLRFWYGRSKILRRELQARVQRLEADNARLRAALEDIRQNQGRVCPEYEVCRHVGCSSSHAAWEVADRALNKETRR